MKVDGNIGLELDKVAERAQEAEAAGYSGAWTAETAHDPFLPLLLAAEHTEHQALGTYIGKMEPAITKARGAGQVGSEPYGRGTLAGRLLVGFLGQPGKTVRAPGVFRPRSSRLDLDEVSGAFRERSAKMIELAVQADGLDLGRIRIATPVSPVLRLSLAQAFEVHVLHTPRHLAQADRVRRHEGFPSS